MNLLAIIIIILALAAAGAIIYVAWELSSDKPRPTGKGGSHERNGANMEQDTTSTGEDPRH